MRKVTRTIYRFINVVVTFQRLLVSLKQLKEEHLQKQYHELYRACEVYFPCCISKLHNLFLGCQTWIFTDNVIITAQVRLQACILAE